MSKSSQTITTSQSSSEANVQKNDPTTIIANELSKFFSSLRTETRTMIQQSFASPFSKADPSHLINNFYLQIDTIYQQSERNKLDFIQEIQEKVAEIYIAISKAILNDLNHNQITFDQAKVFMAEEIITLNLKILKLIGRNNNFQYDAQTFKKLNQFQHTLMGYMKIKYPCGSETYIPPNLIDAFPEFDRTNDIEYDILKNSKIYFGDPNQEKIIIKIKNFIDKILNQCDKKFGPFQKLMKQKVFVLRRTKKNQNKKEKQPSIKKNHNQKSSENVPRLMKKLNSEKLNRFSKKDEPILNQIQQDSKPDVKINYLNPKIGRKIPLNTRKYQSSDGNALQIYSPQILRVLIKWMKNLKENIEKIDQKQESNTLRTFKRYIGDIKSEKSNQIKEALFEQINEYEFPEFIDLLKKQVLRIQQILENKNTQLLSEVDQFNAQFLSVLQDRKRSQRFVPTKEAQVIKYSSYNTKFVEYMVAQRLVFTIKQLINAGKLFNNEKMMTLDLVQFKVTDLMRCMVSGNLKCIQEVYNNFGQLEKKGQIQIIRIKNRLKEKTNDVMINFKMKECFLICEAQLCLNQQSSKIQEMNKNIRQMNHFFYELERSPYGVLNELALNLSHKDNKIKYQKHLTFEEKEIYFRKCFKDHKDSIKTIHQQKSPFICSQCSKFFNKYENIFELYQCNQCRTKICSRCIQKSQKCIKNQELYVQKQIMKKIQHLRTQIAQWANFSQETQIIKKISHRNDFIKRLTPKMVLSIFNSKTLNLNDLLQKKKKIKCETLMKKINEQFGCCKDDSILLMLNFFMPSVNFQLYLYDPLKKVISHSFIKDFEHKYFEQNDLYYSETGYQIKTALIYSNYTKIFFVEKKKCIESDKIEHSHIFLFISQKKLKEQIEKIQKSNSERQSMCQLGYKIISYKLERQFQIVLGLKIFKANKNDPNTNRNFDQNTIKKDFTEKSLFELVKNLPQFRSVQKKLEFEDKGIENDHLIIFFQKITWAMNIKQLNISKNKIKDISVILKDCPNLEKLYFNENEVTQLSFQINDISAKKNCYYQNEMQHSIKTYQKLNLQIVNGSNNKIHQIKGIEFINRVKKLFLRKNKLKQFPKSSDLQHLTTLDVELNHLRDFDNIFASHFPRLVELNIGRQSTQFYRNRKGKYFREASNKYLEDQQLSKNSTLHQRQDQLQLNLKSIINLPSLKYINIGSCEKTKVPKQFMINCLNLQKMTMYLVDIETITLSHLNNLRHVDLEGNKVSSLVFLEQHFKVREDDMEVCFNDRIVELNVSNNPLNFLPILQFSNIMKLNLNNCDLQDIKPLSFSKMPKLQQLDVSSNRFSKMRPLFFGRLKTLYLCKFQKLNNIRVLFESKSKLQSLQSLYVQSCKKLDFTFNISKQKQINRLVSLRYLSFRQSCFNNTRSRRNTFEIDSLLELDLTGCWFDIFPVMKLPSIIRLEITDLDAQNFDNLQKSSFSSLEVLDLLRSTYGEEQNLEHNAELDEDLDDGLKQGKSENSQDPYDNNDDSQSQFVSSKFSQQQQRDWAQQYAMFPPMPGLSEPQQSICSSKIFPKLKVLCLDKYSSNFELFKQIDLQDLQRFVMTGLFLKQNKLPQILSPNLREIIVKQTKIPSLDYFINKDFRKITLATFSECKIQKFSDQTISVLENAEQLNLQSNLLAEFKCSKVLDKLIRLNLRDNCLRSFPQIKAKNLKELNLEENSELTTIKNLENLDCPLLNTISLSKCRLRDSQFPVFNLFNLKQLILAECQLADISNLSKCQLANLKSLNLVGNQLKSIPQLRLPELQQLDLSSNSLLSFNDLFKQRTNSSREGTQNQTLSMYSSQLWLANLKILNLSNNPLKEHLSPLYFPKLQKLYLENLNLSDIERFSSIDYELLHEIYLGYNNLRIIPKFDMKLINYVDLSHNHIENIDQFFDSELNNLTELNLQSNNLEKIPGLRFMKLQMINISDNPLNALDFFVLDKYPNIKKLQASQTLINHVQVLPQMNDMQQIVISGSKLTDLEWLVKSNDNLCCLEALNLSHNKITQISEHFCELRQLCQINLQGNPIQKIGSLESLIKDMETWNIEKVTLTLDLFGEEFKEIKRRLQAISKSVKIERFKQRIQQQQKTDSKQKKSQDPFKM